MYHNLAIKEMAQGYKELMLLKKLPKLAIWLKKKEEWFYSF